MKLHGLFCYRKIGGPIVGIHKLLTEIHERGNQDCQRPRSFFSGNTYSKSDFLCSVDAIVAITTARQKNKQSTKISMSYCYESYCQYIPDPCRV
jgi:hypothetical protein